MEKEKLKAGVTISPFTGMPSMRRYKSWLTRFGLADPKYALYGLINPITNKPVGNEELTEYVDLHSYRRGDPMHYIISNVMEKHSETPLSKKDLKEIKLEIEEREHGLKKIQQELEERRNYIKDKE